MPKTLTETQAMERLRRRIREAGSQTAFADTCAVNKSVLSDVLNGRRDMGTGILDALGLERVIVYREKSNGK